MRHRAVFVAGIVLCSATAALAKPEVAKPTRLARPNGDGGIGFDDLGFSRALRRILAPAGRTGTLV